MKNYRLEAILLAAAIAIVGGCLYAGLSTLSNRDRAVSVRGLAEREVKADHVIWPVVYKTTGNNLAAIYADLAQAEQRITAFLTKGGVKKDDISTDAPQIVDLNADRYSQQQPGRDRYTVTYIVTVSSAEVDKVRQLMSQVGDLLKEGIAISAGEYDSKVQYEFTGLNQIKPEMIEQATRNAREAAQKFAADSDSELGKIKRATQGLFTIEDRDQYTPYIKKVRVVTSVDYYLES
ncbi:MAG: SIMPL domain-containing protein [Alloprevotella sp.]